MIHPGSVAWQYMSTNQKNLISDGRLLIEERAQLQNLTINDYSYLVFPFAKAYEGFLKHLFRDLGIISPKQYESSHFRLGKVLSPNMQRRLGGRSAYAIVVERYGEALAQRLWMTWKEGRNLVLHYFPHNVKKLSFTEAKLLCMRIEDTIEHAVAETHVRSALA